MSNFDSAKFRSKKTSVAPSGQGVKASSKIKSRTVTKAASSTGSKGEALSPRSKTTDGEFYPVGKPSTKSQAQTRWSNIQNNLSLALSEWSEFEAGKSAKSQEEEQLEKVKSIIEDLKDKLSEF